MCIPVIVYFLCLLSLMTSAATSTTGDALLEWMLKRAVSAASGSSACPTMTKFSESVLSSLLMDVKSDAASSKPPPLLLLACGMWSGLRVGLLTGSMVLLAEVVHKRQGVKLEREMLILATNF